MRKTKTVRVFCSLSILPLLLGVPQVKGQALGIAQDRDVSLVIRLARRAPPEYGADALITLVQSGRITTLTERIQLLKDAYRLAGEAQERNQLRLVYPGGVYQPITRAFQKGLDRVSLRTRVAQSMFGQDPKLAGELLEEIQLELPPVGDCTHPYVYDLSIYYSVISAVLSGVQSPVQSPNLDAFIAQLLDHFTSNAQVAPLASLLASMKEDHGASRAVAVYAERLARLDRDPASFSAGVESGIAAIAKLAGRLPAGDRDRLLLGSRAWILRGSKDGVCQGRQTVAGRGGSPAVFGWQTPAERFNARLVPFGSSKLQVSTKEATRVILPRAPFVQHSDAYSALSGSLTLLANDAAKDSDRWKKEEQKIISSVIAWDDPYVSNEQDRDARFFLEKAGLLRSALSVEYGQRLLVVGARSQGEYNRIQEQAKVASAAGGVPDQGRVIRAFTEFLESSVSKSVSANRRIVFYSGISELLRHYDSSEEPGSILSRFTVSREPILELSGQLYKLLATQPNHRAVKEM